MRDKPESALIPAFPALLLVALFGVSTCRNARRALEPHFEGLTSAKTPDARFSAFVCLASGIALLSALLHIAGLYDAAYASELSTRSAEEAGAIRETFRVAVSITAGLALCGIGYIAFGLFGSFKRKNGARRGAFSVLCKSTLGALFGAVCLVALVFLPQITVVVACIALFVIAAMLAVPFLKVSLAILAPFTYIAFRVAARR